MKGQGHAIHGDTTFPMVLREHFDNDIYIDRKIVPMNNPVITKKTGKTFEDGKKKATCPDDIKGELYRALGKSKICVKTLHKVFYNIIDRYLKIKSWGKSNTRLIPKVNKPTAKQLRPIALTDVSYKLFMTIIGKKIDARIL